MPNRIPSLDKVFATLSAVAVCASVAFILAVAESDLFWLLVAAAPIAAYAVWKKDQQLTKIACFTPLFYSFGFQFAHWVLGFNHRRIDGALARIDGGLSAAVWAWCNHHPAVDYVLLPAYYAMGFWILVTLAATKQRREMIRTLAVASVLVVPIYWLFPAVGPRAAGTSETFINAMPSMHLGFALICWAYSPRFLRPLSGVFVALTVAATLGLGEHYVLDLVAACAYVPAVIWITRRSCSLPRFAKLRWAVSPYIPIRRSRESAACL